MAESYQSPDQNHAQKQNTYFIEVHMAHVTTSMLRRKNQSSAQLQSKDAAFKSILYLQRQQFMPKTGLRLPELTRHHFLRLSAAITEHCASPTAEYWLHVIRFGNHQGRQPPSGRWPETSFEAVHVHFMSISCPFHVHFMSISCPFQGQIKEADCFGLSAIVSKRSYRSEVAIVSPP